MPLPKDQEPIALETKIATRKKDPDAIVSSLEGRYLVWKDGQGTLGFGNVQYPEKDPVSVLEADTWIRVQRSRLAADTGREEDFGLQKRKSQLEIASAFSSRYLVWKDERGTLGFGNVQYPERNTVSVFETNTWTRMDKVPVRKQTGPDEDHNPQKRKSQPEIASAFSARYLVWKDKNGKLGFGNVQYPENGDASQVHVNGIWEPAIN
jgi:hypothetical protein